MDSIFSFLSSIADIITNFFGDLLAMWRMLFTSLDLVTGFVGWIPGELFILVVWMVSVAILYKILGR